MQSTLQRVSNRSNVADMACQPFYKWIQDTYTWHVVGLFAALFALGGFPAMVWGGALRIAWVYHITWFVNSASHCWGYQSYNTGTPFHLSCYLQYLVATLVAGAACITLSATPAEGCCNAEPCAVGIDGVYAYAANLLGWTVVSVLASSCS